MARSRSLSDTFSFDRTYFDHSTDRKRNTQELEFNLQIQPKNSRQERNCMKIFIKRLMKLELNSLLVEMNYFLVAGILIFGPLRS